MAGLLSTCKLVIPSWISFMGFISLPQPNSGTESKIMIRQIPNYLFVVVLFKYVTYAVETASLNKQRTIKSSLKGSDDCL
jgi:hypothetical protein